MSYTANKIMLGLVCKYDVNNWFSSIQLFEWYLANEKEKNIY